MKNKLTIYSLIIFTLALLVPISAMAQAVRIPGNYSTTQIEKDVPSAILFGFSYEGGRSYCCNILFSPGTTVASVTGPSGSVNRSRTTPDMTNNAFGRFCYIPSQDGNQGLTASGISPTGMATEIEMKCVETSLYGGFNTSVNNFNFLEITNTSNSSISGFIYATSFDGSSVINAQPFTIASNNRLDIDIHTPAGANKFGTIKVVHDGPFGSILATTSYYKGTTVDFTLTGTVPARPRDRLQ